MWLTKRHGYRQLIRWREIPPHLRGAGSQRSDDDWSVYRADVLGCSFTAMPRKASRRAHLAGRDTALRPRRAAKSKLMESRAKCLQRRSDAAARRPYHYRPSFFSIALTRAKSWPSRWTHASCCFASRAGTATVPHHVPPFGGRSFDTPVLAPMMFRSPIST